MCTLMTLSLSTKTWTVIFSSFPSSSKKLTQAGLKVKLTKCEFLISRIEFLGRLVDGDGIHTVDSKITAVKNFPTSKSVENVRSFLGLAGYYRAFVTNFASIASPLTRLLKMDVPFQWNE